MFIKFINSNQKKRINLPFDSESVYIAHWSLHWAIRILGEFLMNNSVFNVETKKYNYLSCSPVNVGVGGRVDYDYYWDHL